MTLRRLRTLVAVGALWAAGCSVPVASGLEESDANGVVVALEQSGIASAKEADPAVEARFRVSVARDDAAAAAAVLKRESLPPSESPGLLAALGAGSLVPSRTAEHAKLVAGTAGELERSLRAVDGVLSARVHLAVPVSSGFLATGDQPSPTASVLVRHRGSAPPLAIAEIQKLVAGAVPGLSEAQVSVVLTPAPGRPPLAGRELSRFGPLTVTRASMTPLRLIVAGVALLNLILIGLLLALWVKMRRANAALLELRAAAPPASETH